jgi:outer membrane protein assembly factor BamB
VVIDGKLYVLGDDNLVYVYDEVNNEWDARALMPVQAGNLALGVVNGILYVTHDQNWMYAYNPTSDTWSPRMPIHITRSIESFAALNGKLYAIGGGEPGHVPSEIDRIDVYDPAMDSWTIGALASLSVRRTHLGATTPVIDNRIYVIGGWNGYSQQSGVEIYNPHTNTWVAGPSMPTARYALACAALGHIIYCLGGDRGGMGGNWQSANEASVVESAPSP